MAMMSDAISHSILLGIVLAFFVVRGPRVALPGRGRGGDGVLTVALSRSSEPHAAREGGRIHRARLPALFSVGVILIARHASDVHLDVDAVLLGELAFAPFRRLVARRGRRGAALAPPDGVVLLLNLALHRRLLQGAQALDLRRRAGRGARLRAGASTTRFMTIVSVTAVGAFDAVGSILVVALMIAPPAAAYLLTDRLSRDALR
jgi:manganese/zinc/iron transport system permease protein